MNRTNGAEPVLMLPATSNHNQTVFLLALALELEQPVHLLAITTDPTADKLIYDVATRIGVKLIGKNEVTAHTYDLLLSHSWNRHEDVIASVRFSRFGVYGDGLSNRMMIGSWENLALAVVWASELFDPCILPNVQHASETFSVSNASIKKIWVMLAEAAQYREEISKEFGLAGSALLAFRYWGAHTYSGVPSNAIKRYLVEAVGQTASGTPLELAQDSRWILPLAQVSLVRELFPERSVSLFKPEKAIRQRFGHLANLDLLAYLGSSRHDYVIGFDGSIPLTFALTQPDVTVLVPEVDLGITSTIGQVIEENFRFHRSAVKNGATLIEHQALTTSIALRESLEVTSRGRGTVTEYGRVLTTMADNYLGSHSISEIRSAFEHAFYRKKRRQKVSHAIEVLRESNLAKRLYYLSIKHPLLRKIVRKLGQLI